MRRLGCLQAIGFRIGAAITASIEICAAAVRSALAIDLSDTHKLEMFEIWPAATVFYCLTPRIWSWALNGLAAAIKYFRGLQSDFRLSWCVEVGAFVAVSSAHCAREHKIPGTIMMMWEELPTFLWPTFPVSSTFMVFFFCPVVRREERVRIFCSVVQHFWSAQTGIFSCSFYSVRISVFFFFSDQVLASYSFVMLEGNFVR